MSKVPVIIDCDPGHDDAIALLLALAEDKMDVLGISNVAGNSYLENTLANTLKILELSGYEEIPVVGGLEEPITQELDVAVNIHGESGMDGPVLPNPVTEPVDMNVMDFFADLVQDQEDGSVVMIATGPLTNVAMFVKTYPDLLCKLDKISIMGGGIEEGNWSATAEFNIWNDPEAAQIVFESGVPIDIYPLDATHKAHIKESEIELFRHKGPISQFVAELLEFFAIGYVHERGMAGCPMHDPCAVLGVLHPELFDYAEAYAQMDLDGIQTRGTIIFDFRQEEIRSGELNVKVAHGANREKLRDVIVECCEKLDAQLLEE